MVNSTSYTDGQFVLQLGNPVVGGRFTCRVPPPSLPQACVRGGLNASITVDKVEARISILEAKEDDLKAQNINLTHQLGDLKDENVNLTQQLGDLKQAVLGQNLSGEL